jgi:hypothetical protein
MFDLRRADMLSFFKPVVDKIIKLLKDQIRRATMEANSRINVSKRIYLGAHHKLTCTRQSCLLAVLETHPTS